MAPTMKTEMVAADRHVQDILPWSDGYRTGFRVIDNDHRQLFHLVNTLHAAVKRNGVRASIRHYPRRCRTRACTTRR